MSLTAFLKNTWVSLNLKLTFEDHLNNVLATVNNAIYYDEL